MLPLYSRCLSLITLYLLTCAAERDFQFNDDLQVTLVAEPQDEIVKSNFAESASSATQSLPSAARLSLDNDKLRASKHVESSDADADAKTNYLKKFYSKEILKCPYSENKIILSLVLKSHDWKDIVESKKSRAINKLSKFFAIPKEYLKIESTSRRDMHEMAKRSIKRGPNKCSTNRRLGKIEFMIGCGQSLYFSNADSIINQIGEQMRDGSIDDIAGIDFGWWIIWRKSINNRVQRSKRDTEGSGEEEYDEYDYEEEEGAVTDVPTTPTHAHRHHHGAPKPEIPESPITKISINSIEQSYNIKHKKNDHKPIALLPKSNNAQSAIHNIMNIDDEIVKNEVSKLESVISKTIENTEKLKDVPSNGFHQQHIYHKNGVLDGDSSLSKEDDYQIEDIINDDKRMNSDEILPPSVSSSMLASAASSYQQPSSAKLNASPIEATTSRIIYITTVKPKKNHNHHHHHVSSTTLETPKHKFDDDNVIMSSSTTNSYSSSTTTKSEDIVSTDKAVTTPTASSTATNYNPPTPTTSTASHSNSHTPPLSALSTSLNPKPKNNSYKSHNIYYNSESVESNPPTEIASVDAKSTINNFNSATQYASSLSSYSTITTATSTETSKIALSEQNLLPSHPTNSNSNNNEQSTLNSISTTTVTTLLKSNDEATTAPQTNDGDVQPPGIRNASPNSQNEHAAPADTTALPSTTTTPPSIPDTTAQTEYANPSTTATTIAAAGVNEFATNAGILSVDQTTPPPPPSTASASPSIGTASASPTVYPSTISSITFASSVINRKDDEDSDDAVTTGIATESSNRDDIFVDGNSTTIGQEASTATPTVAVTTPRVLSTTTTSTTTFELTNSAPIIKNRLPKLPVVAGKAFSFKVPEETFYDNEDLTSLKLELFDDSGNELKPNSWIQFNANRREIYGMPLGNEVSHWQYKLVATDSLNESVTETMDIAVQQYKGDRSVNHAISIGIKFNKKFAKNIDWQIQLLKGIAESLNDEMSPSPIIVREVRQNHDPSFATFSYYNETLPKDVCPTAHQLNSIIDKLRANLNDTLYPDLSIKTVNYQLVGNCGKASHQITTPAPSIPHLTKNYSPVPRNQVDRVNATVGHLLVFKVPPDTFYDPEDTTDLKLSLLTMERNVLSPRHWLQFDSKNQEFYGIPKVADYGSEEYLLVAEDHEGLSATDALVVVVNHAPKREFSVYFKAKLGIRYEQFNAQMQRKFVERVAKLFDDPTAQYIQVRSITQNHDSDETIVNFYNTTLHRQHNRCPEEEIEMVRSVWFSNGNIRDRVRKIIGNEFVLSNMQIIPMPIGSCHSSDFNGIHRDIIPIKTEEANTTSTFKDDYILTFVLPAVIILLMILLASIVACVLHRRRTGKMELGDEEERKSFRSKGIPVIFQDELDEKPEIGNKSPIILKDEKPPLLPPSYNSTNIDGDNDCDEYVPPPAVVVGNREIRGKSPVTPSYRKPPPYVSP